MGICWRASVFCIYGCISIADANNGWSKYLLFLGFGPLTKGWISTCSWNSVVGGKQGHGFVKEILLWVEVIVKASKIGSFFPKSSVPLIKNMAASPEVNERSSKETKQILMCENIWRTSSSRCNEKVNGLQMPHFFYVCWSLTKVPPTLPELTAWAIIVCNCECAIKMRPFYLPAECIMLVRPLPTEWAKPRIILGKLPKSKNPSRLIRIDARGAGGAASNGRSLSPLELDLWLCRVVWSRESREKRLIR